MSAGIGTQSPPQHRIFRIASYIRLLIVSG